MLCLYGQCTDFSYDKQILQSKILVQMFLFNNIMFCVQSTWKRSNLTVQPEGGGGVGSQYVPAAKFPSEQACAARSSGPHSLKDSISASFSAGFRLNASSWPMFLLKTLNGAEMAPVRIFHKVFYHTVCEDILLACPLYCKAPESQLASHMRSADPRGDEHCPALPECCFSSRDPDPLQLCCSSVRMQTEVC